MEITTRIKFEDPSDLLKSLIVLLFISANVIYCIKCTFLKALYIGETGWRLGGRFREHPRDVETNIKGASKPVARHSNFETRRSGLFYLNHLKD